MEIKLKESLFSDGRFLSVIKRIGQVEAIGNYVIICALAQNYWKRGKKLIPKKIWELSKFPNEFIEFELVSEKEDGIYVHGSKELLNDGFITGINKISTPEASSAITQRVFTMDFLDDDLLKFIADVSDSCRKRWLDEYDKTTLHSKIVDAYEWSKSRNFTPKSVAMLVNKFLKDAPTKTKLNPELEKELDGLLYDKE
jgi:hypothetical protein